MYWCDCRIERNRVGFAEDEESKHVRLVLAVGEDGRMRSD